MNPKLRLAYKVYVKPTPAPPVFPTNYNAFMTTPATLKPEEVSVIAEEHCIREDGSLVLTTGNCNSLEVVATFHRDAWLYFTNDRYSVNATMERNRAKDEAKEDT